MIKHECPTTPPVREDEFMAGPPPLTEMEIDAIERTIREAPPGSDAEKVLQLQEQVRFLLASPKDQDRMIEDQRLEHERLEAYLHWLQLEVEALQHYSSSIEQWCRGHGWTEAELERERQSSHKKTATLTIVMSPLMRARLEKIAQRHRVTIAAWARDVLHHAALKHEPQHEDRPEFPIYVGADDLEHGEY